MTKPTTATALTFAVYVHAAGEDAVTIATKIVNAISLMDLGVPHDAYMLSTDDVCDIVWYEDGSYDYE